MTSSADASLDPLEASPPGALNEHLHDVMEALAAALTQAEILDVVLKPALQALGAIGGTVLLVDETVRSLQVAAHQRYVPGMPIIWQDGSVEDPGPAADVLRTREALYFQHAGELIALYPDLEAQTGAVAAVATAVLPMFLDDRPLGCLVLDFKEPHTFTPQERHFLRTLAAHCTLALDRASSLQLLSQHLEERTRKIDDDAHAQAAFMAFTESVGTETNLPTLVRQAIRVLEGRFPNASIGYFEENDEGSLWQARVWSEDVSDELAAVVSSGLPPETPMVAQVLRTRAPVFTDAWDARQQRVDVSDEYGAVASYPLTVNGELHWVLTVALRNTRTWSEADRRLVRAVGRGLNLALERTHFARQLMLQNAELLARTRALEAFANLTWDLAHTTDALLLIRRAQEVVMSMLADGAALYYVPEGDRWQNRSQHGSLHSPELQAAVDAGLPLSDARNLLTPWTTGQPYFQDNYDQTTDRLAPNVGHIGATATLPLRAGDTPIGVLAFVLFSQRHWSIEDRMLLETAVQSLELALDRAAKTRTLDEERAALEAFTRFTEAVNSETDVQVFVCHAITLLEETRSVDVTYFERQGDLFEVKRWSPALPAELLARLQAGFPLIQPAFARAAKDREAVFEDHWDAVERGVPEGALHGVLAIQPFFEDREMTSALIMGSRTSATWSERDKGIFRAVGHSLELALDRARQTRMLQEQHDALNARTKELAASTEELQAFSYSVSHELRTPVRHMLGFLGLARKTLDGRLDERSARYLDVVEQAGTQMNTLIDALLNLSRAAQQALRPQPVDLNGLMTQIQTTLLPDQLTRNVQWDVAALPAVWGDPDALRQVLTQLTENALKFTRTRDPAIIRVWAEDQGDAWGVFVQDNGLGFDPRYQDRLFNLFQRLHSADEASGTGVGLASVRRLVQKHGGQVFAVGRVGEGATFGFTLPKEGLLIQRAG